MNGTGTLASYSYANYPAGSGIPAVGLPVGETFPETELLQEEGTHR